LLFIFENTLNAELLTLVSQLWHVLLVDVSESPAQLNSLASSLNFVDPLVNVLRDVLRVEQHNNDGGGMDNEDDRVRAADNVTINAVLHLALLLAEFDLPRHSQEQLSSRKTLVSLLLSYLMDTDMPSETAVIAAHKWMLLVERDSQQLPEMQQQQRMSLLESLLVNNSFHNIVDDQELWRALMFLLRRVLCDSSNKLTLLLHASHRNALKETLENPLASNADRMFIQSLLDTPSYFAEQ
jgi:hypothetical protein